MVETQVASGVIHECFAINNKNLHLVYKIVAQNKFTEGRSRVLHI